MKATFLTLISLVYIFFSQTKEKKIEPPNEYFVDSLKIGNPGFNKIELNHYVESESYVVIRFYSKKGEKWVLRNKFQFEKDLVASCDPVLEDYNHDHKNDFTYVSGIAARGANEVRMLFIYNPDKDELISIKNSENFPNLMYNKKLNCVDSQMFHGGTTTVFLKLEKDSLRTIATVNNDNEQVVTIYNKKGKPKEISRKALNPEDIYFRYSTFSPPDF